MKMFWRVIKSLIEGLSAITGFLAAIGIVAASVIITEAVFVRKVLNISTIWQTEISVFLLIFATFVGAAFVQKSDHHLNVDFLLVYLPPKVRESFLLFGSIFTMVLSAVIAWYAYPMWWETVVEGYHSMSLWGPPLWIPYAFIPFGLTLLALQHLVHIVDKIGKFKAGEIEESIVRSEIKDIDLDAAKSE